MDEISQIAWNLVEDDQELSDVQFIVLDEWSVRAEQRKSHLLHRDRLSLLDREGISELQELSRRLILWKDWLSRRSPR